MPQLCKICKHSQREAIDGLMLDGWLSLREIGAQYSVSKDSLFRHLQRHLVASGKSTMRGRSDEARLRRGLHWWRVEECRQKQ